jgi:OOP family OmpA-OmpF porin
LYALVGLMAATAAGSAQAQGDRGLYLGGSAGIVQYEHSCDFSPFPCDDTDDGWRAFAGYRFNRYLSAELGFADLGEASSVGTVGGVPASRVKKVETVFDVSGLLSFGLVGGLDGFVRLGIFHARMTIDETNVFGPGTAQHIGDTNHGWTVGAGLQYNLGFLGVRLEWQRYDDVGGAGVNQDNLDLFSAGLLLRF